MIKRNKLGVKRLKQTDIHGGLCVDLRNIRGTLCKDLYHNTWLDFVLKFTFLGFILQSFNLIRHKFFM